MVHRHVSILKDHPQGVGLYLAKVTELFKRYEEFFNFKTLNLKSRWLKPVLWQQYCNEFILLEDDLLRSKHVGVLLNIFVDFNVINTLE